MSLTGLLDAAAADPALTRIRELAAEPTSATPLLDVTARPAPGRPWSPRSPTPSGARADPVLAVAATGREASELAEGLRCFLPGQSVVDFPSWETLPHERLSPRRDTVGRRLAVLRRLAHPGPRRDDGTGPLQRRGGAGALAAAADGQGPRRPRAGRARARRRGRAGRGGRAARRAAYARVDLVEQARRVRRPRRHPRRLPADRGAPAARRVLGRHRRGGALVQRRRPAQPRGRRPRLWAPPCRELLLTDAVRARAARAGRQLPGSPTCWTRWPRASPSRAWSRWPRCWSTAWSCCSTCCRRAPTSCCATPSGSAPGRTTWSRPAQEFLEAQLGRAAAGGAGADRPRRRGLRHGSYWSLADPRPRRRAGLAVVDGRRSLADRRGARPTATDADDLRRRRRPRRGRRLPRRHRARLDDLGRGCATAGGRRRHRGARPGPADGRACWATRSCARPAGRRRSTGARARRRARHAPRPLGRGFVDEAAASSCVLTEADLTGSAGTRSHQGHAPDAVPAAQHGRPAAAAPGDYVVHEQHGVGRFVEMVQRTVGGARPASTW